MATQSQSQFYASLKKYYSFYTGGFVAFVIIVAILEQMGVPNKILGYIFLAATVALYAGIGIMSKTADVSEYYVAGRRVPALFNGMATGADWMSAASFIGMAGTLYLSGYDGLAFVLGWTGGYCLVALLLAPYLRKFGQFTIPDFLGARYGGNIPRSIGVFAAILCSFTYVIAQIYGVGLITSRFTGLEFSIGVFAGLAGILVCSFLGGMKAVTWTQVAQYIILIVAYMIPVVWLSVKHTNIPVPQVAYGYVLEKVTEREKVLNDASTPDGAREAEVRAIFKQRQEAAEGKLKALETGGAAYLAEEKTKLEKTVSNLKASSAPDTKAIEAAEKAVAGYPADEAAAKKAWTGAANAAKAKTAPIAAHAEPFAGKDEATRDNKRKNFLALVLCLMVGTAALPHILMRYYTTPSVKEARQSVFWSLFFIFLLYFTAPALAVLAKFDVYTLLVGSNFSELPSWVGAWATVDKTLMSITDINMDGIVQLAEITIGGDLIVLATPEIAGLPYVITGLVAAGGLAAALSTADGLLLTIANALSHDVYYKMIDPHAPTTRRLAISKGLLLVVAVLAAYVTSLKPGDILFLVGAAFSLAASAFFPALALGIFWKRANKFGAILGMTSGLGICMYYMYMTYPFFGVNAPLWWGMNPISAGIFGMPVGIIGVVVGSLLTAAPGKDIQDMVDHVRYPSLESDIDTRAS
ncbi:MAG: cation acetate symporter [Gallionellales bacterium 35-53-114]|jgi:cation/acetate symporter|nr:MAG: cation acetate symporter [Gallionellales bacterium 35-53-114]OYZ64015.1 MAG: cation acetate symporter [Gallionellales bacterium 24-53-125]OZB09156.1 MAG: cation acetate symporter [Gallionellales bacterium 39-52-133]HQS59249.1 VC_2705 family sodium/solute symporter [Gallionellaceae bacterium]HQS75985.1 VC_2705 family sodium/solute symporter [Gallionellaceae bacterium]